MNDTEDLTAATPAADVPPAADTASAPAPASDTAQDAQNGTQDAPAPKRRGRKPKAAAQDAQGASDAQQDAPAPKKRGRKPKAAATPAADVPPAADTAQQDDERAGLPSASGMARLVGCPGSWLAEQRCPRSESSEYAAHGTMLHEYMEKGLPTNGLDAEDEAAVLWCRETESKLIFDYIGIETTDAPQGLQIVREKRLWSKFDDAEARFSGKGDVIYIWGDTAFYMDYKFGRNRMAEADENWQLGAMSVLISQNYLVKRVYCALLHPFISRDYPRVVCYEEDNLAGAAQEIAGAIIAARHGWAHLSPDIERCRYCRALATCPAAMRESLTVQAVNRWDILSPEVKRKMFDASQLAKAMCKQIDNAIKSDLKAGRAIPGLALKPGARMTSVSNMNAAFNALHAAYGITEDEFIGCCSVQLGKLDALCIEKQQAKDAEITAESAKGNARALIAEFCEEKRKDESVTEQP